MITEIENVKIEENRINFDFLNNVELKTENEKSKIWDAGKTLVAISHTHGKVSSEFDLCGKKIIDWVRLASSCCEQVLIDVDEDNILATLRKVVENDVYEKFEYVAFLYGDTPLLQKTTFVDIMNRFANSGLNVMKLTRGFVFRADYLKTARILLETNVDNLGKEEFFVVDNAQAISIAFKILNGRILDYHKQNGVVFFGEDTIFVDADVEIEAGTVVYPNNILKGESYIGKSVILESGNYILDTIVCDECFICQSYLEKSKIESGRVVGPFAKIVNQKI